MIPSMLISPIFSMSCNSWFSIWMSLEFNMLTFIPCMIFINKYYKEISIKYFIIQSISSYILLLSTNLMMINFTNILNSSYIYNLLTMSILIKLGSAPFHYWFVNLMNSLNWMNCLILSTWQKIIPLMCLMYTPFTKFYLICMIYSSLIGSIMAINHQSLRIIMSYSSISHISWMMMNLLYSEIIISIYFIIYMMMNFSIMSIFNKMNIFYLNEMFYTSKYMMINKYTILFNFLSLSGMPITFGFLIKWMSINLNIQSNSSLIMLLMMMSIISFFYYIRMCISCLMNLNFSNKMSIVNKFINMKKMFILSFIFMNQFIYLWMMSIIML